MYSKPLEKYRLETKRITLMASCRINEFTLYAEEDKCQQDYCLLVSFPAFTGSPHTSPFDHNVKKNWTKPVHRILLHTAFSHSRYYPDLYLRDGECFHFLHKTRVFNRYTGGWMDGCSALSLCLLLPLCSIK